MRFIVLCSLTVALVACNNNNPGVVITIDGGGGTDSGGGGGTDAGGGGGTDAGGGGCPAMTSPAPTDTAVCASATLTCLMGAASAAEQQACLEADPAPDACLGCLNEEILNTCTSGTAMCGDEYGNLICCLMTACPTGDTTCINGATTAGGACASQVMALQTCTNAEQTARRCGVSTLCFMAGLAPDFGGLRLNIPADLRESLDPRALAIELAH